MRANEIEIAVAQHFNPRVNVFLEKRQWEWVEVGNRCRGNDRMMQQQELPAIAQRLRKSDASHKQDIIRTLRQFSEVGKRWVKAREIAEALGWGWSETVRRKITAAVEKLGWRVIGHRAMGYCLSCFATPEELHHNANTLKSQAKEMERRAIALENFLHRGERAA